MGLEPVSKCLPSAGIKSWKNLVHRHRFSKNDVPGIFLLTKTRCVAMESFYLGSDVSKGYADFVILDSKKQIVEKNFELGDSYAGHNELYEKLNKFMEDRPGAKLYAAVESTGGYENNWYNTLFKCQRAIDVSVTRLNPIGVHHSIKAGMRRNVTDKISAYAIAEFLIMQGENIRFDVDTYYAELRKMKSFVDMLTKQKVQCENQLESVLYSANPEVLVYCEEFKPAWLFLLLLQYPTADKLSRAHLESLKKIPFIKDKQAEQILEKSKKSVASSSGPVTEMLIKEMITQINHLEELIKKHKKVMAKNCKLEEVELLKSIPGIADYSAISLMLEIGLIERFESSKKLASFFGVHPVYKQSGDGKWGMYMSKQGRSAPRATLFMSVFSGIQYNPIIKDVYKKHVKNGMQKGAAMGVCMHKLLRIVYGILKSNKPFDPAIDLENQKYSTIKHSKINFKKDSSFYNIMVESPISGRQRKKRKAQFVSQDVESSKAGS